jgi:2-oxoisovalerate dehydrogenase E1 component beta subunit
MKYVPKEQVEEWRQKDPIDRQEARVRAAGVDTAALREEVKAAIDEGTQEASRCRCPIPTPRPTGSSTTRPTRSCSATATRRGAASRGNVLMATMTYLQAISDAMRQEMRHDERVLVMGEDIGVFGGAFKVTDGFIDEFGPDRVMDTPLAESGIVGTAVGAAVVGMRPIAEMQFADFISCGFDQLVNVAGKMYYRQGPAGEHHRAPAQRRRLLGRPVPLTEPRGVVHALARDEGRRALRRPRTPRACSSRHPRPQPGRLPRAQAPLPPREGRGARRACYETPTDRAHRPRGHRPHGHRLRRHGPHRRSRPPTTSTAPRSRCSTCARSSRSTRRRSSPAWRKTSKVLIVDEANETCAAGAQVAAVIAEKGFEDLDGPVRRVADARRSDPVLAPARAGAAPSVDRVKEAVP